MPNQSSMLQDKIRRASGAVHRPAEQQAGEAGDDDIGEPSQAAHPPPYSAPSSSSLVPSDNVLPPGPQYYPGLPVLDYRLYSPPMFELSSDATSILSKAKYLSENAKALSTLLRNLATVPPKPLIILRGTRGNRIADFDLKLSLFNLLIPDDPRNRMDYLRTIGSDEMGYRGDSQPSLKPDVGDGGLEEWCKIFVNDKSSVKSFELQRIVTNLDANWLEGQLRSLVASTGYKGLVTVSFHVTHSRVIVQTPDKINKFFTSVSTLFTGKAKYETVKAVWPFASARNGEAERKCAVQSEKLWYKEWSAPIRYAIANKRHGWVTNEDKLECIMESKAKDLSVIDWGPDF